METGPAGERGWQTPPSKYLTHPGALTQQALGDQANELPRASQIYLLDHNHLIKKTRRAVVIGDSFLRGTESSTGAPDNS